MQRNIYIQKLASLRAEADAAVARAEAAEAKNKKLEQELLEREQDIKSKDHRLGILEDKFEEASTQLKDTTEKYVRSSPRRVCVPIDRLMIYVDYGEQTSMLNTRSVNPSDMNRNVINGRRNTRYVRLSSPAGDDQRL